MEAEGEGVAVSGAAGMEDPRSMMNKQAPSMTEGEGLMPKLLVSQRQTDLIVSKHSINNIRNRDAIADGLYIFDTVLALPSRRSRMQATR
jgi:hypothetical protein